MTVDIPIRVSTRATHNYVVAENGCYISTYSVASHGYAQIGWNTDGRLYGTTAHRAVWVGVYGQLPPGITVDHMCKERKCVNINHLRALSNFENARRTSGRDWPLGTCIRGHSNDELRKVGSRLRCRLCLNEAQRRRRRARRLALTAGN